MIQRPRTRADCQHGLRPCPWVGCRYHLLLDADKRTGRITINTGGPHYRMVHRNARLDEDWANRMVDALEAMPETCALDVADYGGVIFAEIGRIWSMERERVRQIVIDGIDHIRTTPGALESLWPLVFEAPPEVDFEHRGRCKDCGRSLLRREMVRCDECTRASHERVRRLRICPNCGGVKSPPANLCRACRIASRHRRRVSVGRACW